MLTPDKLFRAPAHEQYFAYAEAYLDSASRLCQVMARSKRKATYQRGAVILFLTQHGMELFYKGAILRRNPTERWEHGVTKLRKRYKNLYPGKRFEIPELFKTSYPGFTKAEIAQLERNELPLHELYRYPEGKAGATWRGLHAFEAKSFYLGLLDAKEAVKNAIEKINA